MKKLFPFALVAVLAMPVFAATEVEADEDESMENPETLEVKTEQPRKNVAWWPAFVGFGEWPTTPDLVGMRFTIPYSSKQDNVTGLDIGLWGRSTYYEGIQINILRSDVKDALAGIQIGMYNTVTRGDLFGCQVGFWNESYAFSGFQVGLVNVSGFSEGFQVGVINRSETMSGFQLGLINIIRDSELRFFPGVNIGF